MSDLMHEATKTALATAREDIAKQAAELATLRARVKELEAENAKLKSVLHDADATPLSEWATELAARKENAEALALKVLELEQRATAAEKERDGLKHALQIALSSHGANVQALSKEKAAAESALSAAREGADKAIECIRRHMRVLAVADEGAGRAHSVSFHLVSAIAALTPATGEGKADTCKHDCAHPEADEQRGRVFAQAQAELATEREAHVGSRMELSRALAERDEYRKTLEDLDRWLENSRFGELHPWRISIAKVLAPVKPAQPEAPSAGERVPLPASVSQEEAFAGCLGLCTITVSATERYAVHSSICPKRKPTPPPSPDLISRAEVLRIIREQPNAEGTHAGTRQQWLRDELVRKVEALPSSEKKCGSLHRDGWACSLAPGHVGLHYAWNQDMSWSYEPDRRPLPPSRSVSVPVEVMRRWRDHVAREEHQDGTPEILAEIAKYLPNEAS